MLGDVKTSTITGGAVVEKQITLKDDFDWFLTEDFLAVRNLLPYSSESLPTFYSEGEYPVRSELEDEGLGGSFFLQHDNHLPS